MECGRILFAPRECASIGLDRTATIFFGFLHVVHVYAERAKRDVALVLLHARRTPAPKGRKVREALEVVVVRVPSDMQNI